MTDCPSPSDDSPQFPPRLPITFPVLTDFSYADLLETHASASGLPLLDALSDTEDQHRYPIILQSLITRLENCGRLANTRDIARHSRKTKKGSESGEETEPDDRYYDLDDGFMEEEEGEKENEGEFEEAVREGHYILRPGDLVSPQKAKNTGKKRKAQDLNAYPDSIRLILTDLDGLYMGSQKANPKGAAKLVTAALRIMLKDADSPIPSIDRVSLCLTLSEISGFSLEKIEALAGKLAANQQLARVNTLHQSNIRRLKAGITVECRSMVPNWSKELQAAYQSCLDSLEQVIIRTNELNSMRKRPVIEAGEEEKRLEKEVESWSNQRFIMENRQISVILLERTAIPPSSLQAYLQTRSEDPVVVNLEGPPRAATYDPMPQYASSDFQAVIDLIDS